MSAPERAHRLVELVLLALAAGAFDPRADDARADAARRWWRVYPVQTALTGFAHPPTKKGSR